MCIDFSQKARKSSIIKTDEITLSIPVKSARGNGGTYASYITVTNLKTKESTKKSFNEITPLLSLFELTTVSPI